MNLKSSHLHTFLQCDFSFFLNLHRYFDGNLDKLFSECHVINPSKKPRIRPPINTRSSAQDMPCQICYLNFPNSVSPIRTNGMSCTSWYMFGSKLWILLKLFNTGAVFWLNTTMNIKKYFNLHRETPNWGLIKDNQILILFQILLSHCQLLGLHHVTKYCHFVCFKAPGLLISHTSYCIDSSFDNC